MLISVKTTLHEKRGILCDVDASVGSMEDVMEQIRDQLALDIDVQELELVRLLPDHKEHGVVTRPSLLRETDTYLMVDPDDDDDDDEEESSEEEESNRHSSDEEEQSDEDDDDSDDSSSDEGNPYAVRTYLKPSSSYRRRDSYGLSTKARGGRGRGRGEPKFVTPTNIKQKRKPAKRRTSVALISPNTAAEEADAAAAAAASRRKRRKSSQSLSRDASSKPGIVPFIHHTQELDGDRAAIFDEDDSEHHEYDNHNNTKDTSGTTSGKRKRKPPKKLRAPAEGEEETAAKKKSREKPDYLKGDPPTAEQRALLKNHKLGVAEITDYLIQVEAMTPNNIERVMTQIEMFIDGKPIEYHHWPKDVVFAVGHPMNNLSEDFFGLRQRAINHEKKYGKYVLTISIVGSFWFVVVC